MGPCQGSVFTHAMKAEVAIPNAVRSQASSPPIDLRVMATLL